MKKILVAVLALVISAACGPKSKDASNPSDVAATVGTEKITIADIDKGAQNQLKRVDMEVYRLKKAVLDDLIEEKLLASAASKKGVSVEEYVKSEIDSKVADPTDQEIETIYNAHKGKDTRPLSELKEQIRTFLKNNKLAQTRQALMANLRKDADVKVFLEPPRIEIENLSEAPSIGPNDAKVTIVDFSDYQCPFCKRVRETVWRLVNEYDGKVKYVFMDFPLSFHPQSEKAHEAAHCAGNQGKYFDYNKKVYENQSNIEVADLKKYAQEMSLDMAKFDKCLDSSETAATVTKFMESGMKAGVSGTPAFYINGILLSGAQPYEAFKEVIDAELKK